MKIGYDAKRIFHNTTGLGNYGRDIVRILTGHPAISHLFLFNPKASSLSKKVELGKATIVYPAGWFWKNFTTLWRLFGESKQLSGKGVDIFHGLSGELPMGLPHKKVASVVTIHDLIFLSHPHYYNFFDRIIYRLKFQHAVNHADRVIAISEQTKKDIIKYLRTDADKITVIYQGCNEVYQKEYTTQEKQEVRKKFNLPEKFILNVGTLQERKNALSVVRAIKDTKYHLVLVGQEKAYAKKIKKYIRDNHMEHQVSFIKNISSEELATVYQCATVFCYPSICEGFGIPIIEALYSKLPVITTKNGCFPEAAGPDSIFVDPMDTKEIKTALEDLFSHPVKRAEMAKKGFVYVQRFSDANVAQNLVNLYKNLT
ncbi:Mannosyltransferase [Croceitalea dokdonensis DOKDO 023]|uniref:Mannosyltransferase n=1 Tax=Croceitalea dokdonensis DOKDO 023 TaxID=1300341 RepID=A0A0P7AUU1_9FLAO|nr:glycosyltransferase family 1 protein [Croceitalea dokdonensis]KPM31614.1 Mannosyltransferase [Croceitalea dokdonensis DOKDO 023]